MPAPPSCDPNDKDSLEAAIASELFGLQSFAFTALGCLASIPLARYAPPAYRFTPLLVLGATGSLLDWTSAQRRAEPLQRRLAELTAPAAGRPAPPEGDEGGSSLGAVRAPGAASRVVRE